MLVLISLDLKMTNSVSLEGATSDEGANDDLGIVDVTVALIENRAKEIGMAVFDGTHVSLRLLQFIGESPMFFLLLHLGCAMCPMFTDNIHTANCPQNCPEPTIPA